jgi:hypothetical protein
LLGWPHELVFQVVLHKHFFWMWSLMRMAYSLTTPHSRKSIFYYP